jgi:membrane protease YdiL (CAAX protease family)
MYSESETRISPQNATMNRMHSSFRGLCGTVLTIWVLLSIVGVAYARDKGIPDWVVIAIVPCFLLEIGLYLSTGFSVFVDFLKRIPPVRLAWCMTLSAGVPYTIYSVGTGTFQWLSLAAVLVLAAVASFWYVVLPVSAVTDAGYLILMAAAVLFKNQTFQVLYVDAFPRIYAPVLGLLMWYRLGLISLLVFRRLEGVDFGFVPQPKDWLIGVRNFALFLPVGYALAVWLDFIRPFAQPLSFRTLLVALGTFVVTLWVLALIEEFFFRGVLQQMLSRVLRSPWLALIGTSVVFGASHLGYRAFPNWRFALLATVAGLFYGRAFMQAKGIRAAMVTHALVVTTWKVFLA